MRIREERKRGKRRRIGWTIALILVMLIALGVFVALTVFTVEDVVVEGNEVYSDHQIRSMVLNDKYSDNSLYVLCKYRLIKMGEVPFVDDMEVSLDSPHVVRIKVYEKGILGCFYIDVIGQYAYFDKDGFVVETSAEVIEDVPRVTGITCNEVTLYEKLPLEDGRVLSRLLELTQTLNKYNLAPQEIHYTDQKQPELTYDSIKVVVGSDEYLSQKVVRLSTILPQLYGFSGTLHLEDWTPETTGIHFERDM